MLSEHRIQHCRKEHVGSQVTVIVTSDISKKLSYLSELPMVTMLKYFKNSPSVATKHVLLLHTYLSQHAWQQTL